MGGSSIWSLLFLSLFAKAKGYALILIGTLGHLISENWLEPFIFTVDKYELFLWNPTLKLEIKEWFSLYNLGTALDRSNRF